jgi:hypothetical protein
MSREEGGMTSLRRFRMEAPGVAVIFLVVISLIVSSDATAGNANGSRKAALSDFKRLEGKWQKPE